MVDRIAVSNGACFDLRSDRRFFVNRSFAKSRLFAWARPPVASGGSRGQLGQEPLAALVASGDLLQLGDVDGPESSVVVQPVEVRLVPLAVVDETAQARYVAQQILDAREAGVPLKSQATLFRASHHSAQLEIELARRNIPFVKYGGLKFLEAAHIKDVVSVFRWAENPTDRVAAFRVLKLLPGIGPTTAAKVQDHVEAAPGRPDVLLSIDVPKAAAEDWPAFAKVIARMRKGKSA
jgi:hypothetical protein